MKLNKLQTEVFTLLLEMAAPIKKGTAALQKAQEQIKGGYNVVMEAAHKAGSWDVFEPAIDTLMDAIRRNDDNLAVKFGAEKRDKPGKNGEKYKIPSAVSTARSRVKKAFELGVSLTDKDGKVRTYNAVHQEIKKVDSHQREEQKRAELTGDDLVRHNINEACSALNKHAATLSGADLAKYATALWSIGEAWNIDMPTVRADVAGELDEAADEAAEPKRAAKAA